MVYVMHKLSFVVCIMVTVAFSTAQASVLTVGAGGTFSDFDSALAAAGANDTIQFVDSATYNLSSTYTISGRDNLTIESAAGQNATMNFTGSGAFGLNLNSTGITLQNLTLSSSGRTAIVTGGVNATITGANFIDTNTSSTNLLETGDGANISYSTFYGSGTGSSGGRGISWSRGTAITVDHVSFDNLFFPIYNPSTNDDNGLTVTNSAFGAYGNTASTGGIVIDGDKVDVAFEDYNAAYGPKVFQRLIDASNYIAGSGANSVKFSSYADVFAGDTSAGDWSVNPALYTAASDGTTTGAWQVPEPASLVILGVGLMLICGRGRDKNSSV